MAQDTPGEARLRDLLGLGRDESDRPQSHSEGRFSKGSHDRFLVGRFGGGYHYRRGSRQGLSFRPPSTWQESGASSLKSKKWFMGGNSLPDPGKISTVLYNQGVASAILSVEAIRRQREIWQRQSHDGRAGPLGMENLNITDARLKSPGRHWPAPLRSGRRAPTTRGREK